MSPDRAHPGGDAIDVGIAGGGAAGLATAIFTARRAPAARVVVFDSARRLGAKVLVSGGGRCNVTNAEVKPSDYWGGDRHLIGSVLRAFPVSRTVEFFRELGVVLHEEERGKLFPDSNSSRTVLDALLREAGRLGVEIRSACRVTDLRPVEGVWRLTADGEAVQARRVVLATGGLSLPKTGSDGGGLAVAAALGHSIVPTTPALVPLVLDGDFHRPLAGVSHEAILRVEQAVETGSPPGPAVAVLEGPLLWTHFGISGPAALDASRHCLRVALDGGRPILRVSFTPGFDFAAVERAFLAGPADAMEWDKSPRRTLRAVLARWVPASVAGSLLAECGLAADLKLSQLARDARRRLAHALTGLELRVTGSRGYNYAEATAGGVSLDEIDARTMESRRQPGLHLVGEMLDVDGRLGGFNFQWAWSSARVAGEALARRVITSGGVSPPPSFR